MVAPYARAAVAPTRQADTAIIMPVNNPLERLMREIRRRTRVVGAFPDGQSALNLAAARLRHIAGTRWSAKRYLDMNLLRQRMLTTQTA
jgi:transposase-like protein